MAAVLWFLVMQEMRGTKLSVQYEEQQTQAFPRDSGHNRQRERASGIGILWIDSDLGAWLGSEFVFFLLFMSLWKPWLGRTGGRVEVS